MFPRKDRLRRATFPLAASSKKRITTAHFSLSSSASTTGYAAVVSKKVAKRATDRHLLKRRVLAALRTHKLPPALIVYARAGAPALSFAAIKEELAAGLAKVS